MPLLDFSTVPLLDFSTVPLLDFSTVLLDFSTVPLLDFDFDVDAFGGVAREGGFDVSFLVGEEDSDAEFEKEDENVGFRVLLFEVG